MSARLLLALLAVVAMTAFAPAPFPKKGRGEELNLQTLQGYWKVEKCEKTTNAGYGVVTDPVTHIHVEGDTWTFMQGKGARTNVYTVIVDPTHKPVWLTFRNKNQASGGTQGLIARLGTGRVKILYQWGGARPTGFEKPPSGYWALTLVRDR